VTAAVAPVPTGPPELGDLGVDLAAAARDEAAGWDRDGALPAEVRRAVAATGLLAADLPVGYGGLGATPVQVGELRARLGGVCSTLRALVTVQAMVAAAVRRWGTVEQRARWLPAFARGELLAGFAATEAGAGSDLAAVGTRIRAVAGGQQPTLELTGVKRWVTFGQVADVVLVLGELDGQHATVLVETDRAGVTRQPVEGQLGLRAAQLAHIQLDGVRVPATNRIAPPGFGLSHVAATALDHGRFTVGWGCVGMAEACLRDMADHVLTRRQGHTLLAEHQTVRALLGRTTVDTAAARELATRAARLRASGSPDAVAGTVAAKYAAARTAASVAGAAVQLLGAAGCAPDSRVARFYRDAKVMEIIEGSAQVAELHIADHLLRRTRATGSGGRR
jgi:alkylation response protein AidB-like acyl-CoA dehydrogenase